MQFASATSRIQLLLAIGLLWLAGNGLRLTILAVPPVIAKIRDDFALNATEVGLLSSIPLALFALAALGGSLLVTRLGIRRALFRLQQRMPEQIHRRSGQVCSESGAPAQSSNEG